MTPTSLQIFSLAFCHSEFNLSHNLYCLPFGSQWALWSSSDARWWHAYFEQKGTGVSPWKELHASKVVCCSRRFLPIPILSRGAVVPSWCRVGVWLQWLLGLLGEWGKVAVCLPARTVPMTQANSRFADSKITHKNEAYLVLPPQRIGSARGALVSWDSI